MIKEHSMKINVAWNPQYPNTVRFSRLLFSHFLSFHPAIRHIIYCVRYYPLMRTPHVSGLWFRLFGVAGYGPDEADWWRRLRYEEPPPHRHHPTMGWSRDIVVSLALSRDAALAINVCHASSSSSPPPLSPPPSSLTSTGSRTRLAPAKYDGYRRYPGCQTLSPRVGGVRLGSYPRVSLIISEHKCRIPTTIDSQLPSINFSFFFFLIIQ